MFELQPMHAFKMMKLIYLPLRARAEALRMLLLHTKIPFANQIVSLDEWPALKPSVPNHQLPQLQLGEERMLPHTRDIALHIATLAGPPVLPADAADAASALECWGELHTTSLPHIDDPWSEATPWDARVGVVNPLLNFVPEEKALPLVGKYLEGTRPWLETLDERVRRRPEGAFMGGATPHHGEFATFCVCDNICTLGGGTALSAAASPAVNAWFEAMRSLPAVSSYLRARPKAGSGAVGRPGSLIHRHADVSAVVDAYRRR